MFYKTKQSLDQLVQNGSTPGISYQIKTNQLEENNIMGLKSVFPEAQILPRTTENIYDIASLTKVIATTTRILQLIEQHRFQLEDPVQMYLPNFQHKNVTILHLLTHSSGLAQNIPNFQMNNPEDVMRYVYATPQVNPPGTEVTYADANFLLLGYLISKMEGNYEQAIQQHILTPLKMTQSSFHPTNKEQVIPTELDQTRGLIQGVVHDFKAWTAKSGTGHAGLFSTLTDLSKFRDALILQHGAPILSEQMLQLMQTNHTPGLNRSRGLGWDLRGESVLYHTGFTGTFMVLDLKHQASLIVLSNRVHPSRANPNFVDKRDSIVDTFLEEVSNIKEV
ncbi:serine hydrolase domain-containing protein [Listeria swaminathanii]|uniref:Serine hydrolase domain-containing protein n=1 Tax=Listeria swaminathanii TaxID=2713501 RepID=A0ABU2IF17_9LIST|nr:serine hydrolase domain-containing protein [Listeria swaminathanii]MDT0017688.1 serine hydrolase domain-containing protein [Listeria swaminathanii]MDT0022777.1 serine hydrolase domain-containing protein [Listeria swaminathanii]MDT0033741.1 serine hydrolase domain-containing protein [Listeria swaminathanii]MDT0052307.1 serine hydrolase domain-containing protein [Listeria swaminathanii]MDT0055072.1 serine hydrolase domain-containing protein [Listeria swaminathanii]